MNEQKLVKELADVAEAHFLPEIESLRAQLASARKALEAVEDALPVGIIVSFAGIPIDHSWLNEAMEMVRSEIRVSK